MAAMLGWIHKLGRFRIRVKPDMCISCGNCSTYCEMGIDVRSYAQNNESFTRASCVGCGMCAHMCPRGVLKLENSWDLADDKQRQRLPVVNFKRFRPEPREGVLPADRLRGHARLADPGLLNCRRRARARLARGSRQARRLGGLLLGTPEVLFRRSAGNTPPWLAGSRWACASYEC